MFVLGLDFGLVWPLLKCAPNTADEIGLTKKRIRLIKSAIDPNDHPTQTLYYGAEVEEALRVSLKCHNKVTDVVS